jgi:uncharacterized protein (TIGR03118 family)
MPHLSRRAFVTAVTLGLALAFAASNAYAQYQVTFLVADQSGKAAHQDEKLKNAWGLAAGPTPFWVSDNDTGFSTLYDAQGNPQSLVVTIPPASREGRGSPTGIVFNGTGAFRVTEDKHSDSAFFLFATLDGTISGWNPSVDLTHAVIAVNQSANGVVYTGLAIANDIKWLYGADAGNNKVDAYDANFNLVTTFTDPNLPEGFAPYGIQVIDKKVYVTFASTGTTPGGFVDTFDEFGGSMHRLISNEGLNQPWGLALAPANFGPFSNALLVGNNLPGGVINAYDPVSGKHLGKLTDAATGKPLVINQLWGLEFGGGLPVNGATNRLFFTAGTNNYADGRFGVIQFVQP